MAYFGYQSAHLSNGEGNGIFIKSQIAQTPEMVEIILDQQSIAPRAMEIQSGHSQLLGQIFG